MHKVLGTRRDLSNAYADDSTSYTWTRLPRARLSDVYFTRGVGISHGHAWQIVKYCHTIPPGTIGIGSFLYEKVSDLSVCL